MLYRREAQLAQALLLLPQYLKGRGVCVQAGGNWGLWPLKFADLFETVYTFEPDAICFTALANNTRHKKNVVRFQAALGYERNQIDLWRDVDTTGNQHVEGPGIYPTLRIDDLALKSCDLIYLDIEGEEVNALQGAEQTIARTRPLVIFEARNSLRESAEAAQGFMKSIGYMHKGHIASDLVMVP